MKVEKAPCKPCPKPDFKIGDVVYSTYVKGYGIVTDVRGHSLEYTALTESDTRNPGGTGSDVKENFTKVNATLCIEE